MTEITAVGIVFAGGNGDRFSQSGPPKQYALLNGRAVIEYVLDALVSSDYISHIVIGAQPEWFDFLTDCVTKNRYDQSRSVHLVPAGDTSLQTRLACLRYALQAAGESAIGVLIDAVRPLVTQSDVDTAVKSAKEFGLAVASKKATETILYREPAEDRIISVPRSLAHVAVAPQAGPLGECVRLHEWGLELGGGGDAGIDLSTLAVHAGLKPAFFDTSSNNTKLTYKEDLELASVVLRAQDAKK
jgi:2-C-methyl-D-erythritol 4-phosphate cytidylyltransferase